MSEVDTAALLDMSFDAIEDLPSYAAFPPGVYSCKLGVEMKTLGTGEKKKTGIELSFTHVSTQELADPNAVSPVAGDKCSTFYDLGNKFGAGAFKEVTKDLRESLGAGNLGDFIEKANGIDVAAVLDIRKDPNDSDKHYTKVKQIATL